MMGLVVSWIDASAVTQEQGQGLWDHSVQSVQDGAHQGTAQRKLSIAEQGVQKPVFLGHASSMTIHYV